LRGTDPNKSTQFSNGRSLKKGVMIRTVC
jgi:hypothetical protein